MNQDKAFFEAIYDWSFKNECAIPMGEFLENVLRILREKGWRSPHDPVTEEMVDAAMIAYDDCYRVNFDAIRGPMTVAIKAAMKARKS